MAAALEKLSLETPTERLYLSYEGNFLLECSATVVSCKRDGDVVRVAFDRSCFHPQGGGQPSDVGEIVSERTGEALKVAKATYDFGTKVVSHAIAAPAEGDVDVDVGDVFALRVDGETRDAFSRCHTAGHMVDSAMVRAGYSLPPNKGYHFLDGPYVEYKGTVPAEDRPALVASLRTHFAALKAEAIATTIVEMDKDEADERLNRVQKNFDFGVFTDPTVRIVGVAGFECPCGGTHLRNTSDVADYTVTGIKVKKGVVRVKYDRET